MGHYAHLLKVEMPIHPHRLVRELAITVGDGIEITLVFCIFVFVQCEPFSFPGKEKGQLVIFNAHARESSCRKRPSIAFCGCF